MQQNYILQLNQFHRWLETHYLSAQAQLLWFKFIGLFNACGWADWVQVDTRRLMMMICADNKQTAYRARDALVEAGLLAYKKGKKGCPTQYRLLYFRYDFRTENGTDPVTDRVTKAGHINKQKDKQKEKEKVNEKKNNLQETSEPAYVPPALANAWAAFAKARREQGNPVSDEEAEHLLRTLQTMYPHSIEMQRYFLLTHSQAACA